MCWGAVTVTALVALLMVVPLDGLDSVTEKVRLLVCECTPSAPMRQNWGGE